MYKKIILTLFLSNIIFSASPFAGLNDDLNQNGKRLISHDDNSAYKINTSSKDILINQISDDVLDPNDFESMDVFFKTIEKLLLDIDYAQDLQKIILNLSDNF
ncbi:MAG: hypothetical protein Q8K37_01870, partial [Alphaproteobacteria bacterium]|nr:hypothetical protein [Alphaproteobacteria bacterium]